MARIFMLKGDINRPGHVDIPEESTTLREVVEQFHPDRILIEPSGVGKLSDVIVAVENTVKDVPDMKLNSFVTVADATKVKIYMKNFGEFYNNQIEAAGTIILSRTQKLSQEKLEAAAAAVCAMGLAGEIAHARLSAQDGNSTYRNYIIDAIYNMTPEQLEEGAKYEVR